MKILILAIGKSGTTALLHKIGSALPDFLLYSGGKLDKATKTNGDAIFKFTLSEQKGRSFENFREHLERTNYDRKIWIARDPRDNAISRSLFRWYRGSETDKEQYRKVISLVEKKEQNPESVNFCEIMRYIPQQIPISVSEGVEKERFSYNHMHQFVSELGNDWFIYKYEDLVDNNFEELNEYLGFEIKAETDIDKYTQKVARKKSSGDWRHWYTEEDVDFFRPAYSPYMELIGYNINDWTLETPQVIEPKYASLYLKGLPKRRRLESFDKFKKKVKRFFSRGDDQA